MSNIEEILEEIGKRKLEEIPKLVYPDKIKFTPYALAKAFRICDFVTNIRGPIEWYGLMLGTKDALDVTQEILIPEQDNTHSHTKVDGASLGKALEEMRKENNEFVPIGWIHSHVDFAVMFSQIDYDNIVTVLNSMHLNTKKKYLKDMKPVEGKKFVQIENDKLTISGSLSTDLKCELTSPEAGFLAVLNEIGFDLNIYQPVLMGWTYNVVVNNKRETYGEIAVREEIPLESSTASKRYKADIVLVKEKKTRMCDLTELAKEINTKIQERRKIEVAQGFFGKLIFGDEYESAQTSRPWGGYSGSAYPLRKYDASYYSRDYYYTPDIDKDAEKPDVCIFLSNFVKYDPYNKKDKLKVYDALREIKQNYEKRKAELELEKIGKEEIEIPSFEIYNEDLVRAVLLHCTEQKEFSRFIREFNARYYDPQRSHIVAKYFKDEHA